MTLVRSIALFAVAGLAEIGGGYLMWLWLREGRPLWIGLVGAAVIVIYGIIPTLQPVTLDFGKVYAAYGGAFIALSLLWGWAVDGVRPDPPSQARAARSMTSKAATLPCATPFSKSPSVCA